MEPAGFPKEPLRVHPGKPQSKSRMRAHCGLRSATSGDINGQFLIGKLNIQINFILFATFGSRMETPMLKYLDLTDFVQ